jgi:regulator of sirC expression with transglutaminase-like and TPR domain
VRAASGPHPGPETAIPITDTNLAALLQMLENAEPDLRERLVCQLAEMSQADFERVEAAAQGADAAVRAAVRWGGIRRGFAAREDEWRALVARPRPALERALILLGEAAGVQGVTDVTARLDRYAEEMGDRLSGDRAFDVGLTVLAEVLGNRHQLRGNIVDYNNPANAYLQTVLENGLGIPISLTSVALLVGQRLELPVHGIGTPGHFLGFYGDADLGVGTFFDAFDGFKRLTKGDVRRVLARYVSVIEPQMLKPVTEQEILARSLRNLIGMHEARNDQEHARNLATWLKQLQPE